MNRSIVHSEQLSIEEYPLRANNHNFLLQISPFLAITKIGNRGIRESGNRGNGESGNRGIGESGNMKTVRDIGMQFVV